jgi:hypothetical protein
VSKPINKPVTRKPKMKTVKVPAIKKSSGKVVKAKSKQQSHAELETKGERGFILSDGKFAGREEAATVAKKAKQVPKTVKKLHSEDLRKKKK